MNVISAEYHSSNIILVGTDNGKVVEYSVADKKLVGPPVRIGGDSQKVTEIKQFTFIEE